MFSKGVERAVNFLGRVWSAVFKLAVREFVIVAVNLSDGRFGHVSQF
jgi:hypothetical protein